MASLSLKKHFLRKTVVPFLVAMFVLVMLIWGMGYSLRQSQADSILEYRVNVAGLSFSAYLDRAEFEAKYLAQQVSNDGSLDSLFQLHDVLFFGGLDFFYITLADDEPLEDPRARLYTNDSLSYLARSARLNYWRHISTADGAELLVYKKPLQPNEQSRVQGYLYGFVSLNNNLALSSDLMSGAQVDYMELSSVSGKMLLSDQLPAFDETSRAIEYTGILELPTLEDKLTIKVKMARPFSESLEQNVLINAALVLICLMVLFWIVMHNAYRWMFSPLQHLTNHNHDAKQQANFEEFLPVQQQMNHFEALLKARDQHFHLLLDSLNCAILFCDESARLTAINQESKAVFPDYMIAKTIFDMTPIAFHQPIQRALKGLYDDGFEIELPELGKIYQWHTYSFINEFGFRSVMLVGRDISEVRHLRWQLTNILPRHTIDRPYPDSHIVLNELDILHRSHDEHCISPQYWLLLIGHLLKQISQAAQSASEFETLGEFVMAQQEELAQLAVEGERYGLVDYDISMDAAQVKANWTSDHKVLIQLALVLCMTDSILTRRLTMKWEKSGLLIRIVGVGKVSPAMKWMLQEFPKLVRGHAIIEEGCVTIFTSLSVEAKSETAPLTHTGQRLALIENDFDAAGYCSSALLALGAKVDRFLSFEEFLSSDRALGVEYDAVIVAVGDQHSARKGVERLRSINPDTQVPLFYICERHTNCRDGQIVYAHQLMRYRLAQVINETVSEHKINLRRWLSTSSNWLIVGGSNISQIIWLSELQSQGIVGRREQDLEVLLEGGLAHAALSVVLVLDQASAQRLQPLVVANPQIHWLVLEDFAERPATMTYFNVQGQPPNSELVQQLIQRFDDKKG
ncbi:hypothetical protein [Marinomonas ostreistagni]|uniref:hypothetical protein n=1 Tax=Marinomonas ostreistagni TaxID=359209 RepID=UPI00194E6BFB|nr:hypothetical protein [Marinomonas ostreistagni]MBM6550525.1 hypothetical protein [Marinomonas ostreistagni]